MNKSFKRTTEYQPELAKLHDYLDQHNPIYAVWSYAWCSKCGAPLMTNKQNGTWKTIDKDIESNLTFVITKTNRYNKWSLQQLSATPYGAYFIAHTMDKVKPEYKKIACESPNMALFWAIDIDKKPTKETWLGVRDYETERTRYKAEFGLSDEQIRNKHWFG